MDKISRSVMEAARARVLKYIRRSRIALVHTDMNLTQAAAILSANNTGIAMVVDDEPEKPHLCDRCKYQDNQVERPYDMPTEPGRWKITCELEESKLKDSDGKLMFPFWREKYEKIALPSEMYPNGKLHITECKCFAEKE